MSSEGSVTTSTTSRVRQFGLYRTIDARTEEFLRLSRKRQIKQGCACAAVSTAITVTVVITVFLVYMEYGITAESSPQPIGKAGWMGLINDSLASSLEEKFSKNKLNFDRTTIKLLPILIKAFKQNRYLEKIIEDYSSPSPPTDGKFTTEYAYQKNIFATRNLLKKPTSKLYAIEYKTSPIVFFKNSNRDIGYFTKIRKIRDYQRVMSYVNKMINDNAGFQIDTSVYSNEYFNTLKPTVRPHTPPRRKLKPKTNKVRKTTKPPTKPLHTTTKPTPKKNVKKVSEVTTSCKCPKQLTLILDKILTSIQQLIPDRKLNTLNPCETESNKQENLIQAKVKSDITTTTATTTHGTIKTTTHRPKEYSILRSMKNNLKLSEFSNLLHKEHLTRPSKKPKTATKKKDYRNKLNHWLKNNYGPTTLRQYIELPVYTTISSTEPMLPTTSNLTHKPSSSTMSTTDKNNVTTPRNMDQTKTRTIKIFKSTTNTAPSIQTTKRKVVPLFSDVDYDDFTDVTQNNKHNNAPASNIEVIALNKPSIAVNQKHHKSSVSITTVKNNMTSDANDTFMRSLKTTTNKNYMRHWFKDLRKLPTKTYISSSTDSTTHKNLNHIDYIVSTTNEIKDMTTNLPVTEYIGITPDEYTNFDYVLHKMTTEQITTESKTFGPPPTLEDPRDEDYQEELKEKSTEHIPSTTSLGHSPYSIKPLILSIKKGVGTKQYKHETKSNNKNEHLNSMLPQSRPTYLHIQRNGWKQEDIDDYDNSAKYNLYDLI